jgi:acetoin utilization protein AcuB
MLVGERMTERPVTVMEDTSVSRALELMRREKVRRFPVVDKHGKLVGIVLEKDLIYAAPSPATTLSIFEIHTLLAKIKVGDVMTQEVITVTEDTPLEEAARIMADNNISGMPVMRDGQLVGIITETDIFKVFLEMLGGRDDGVRLSVQVPHEKGVLAGIAGEIAGMGGNIVALGTVHGDDPAHYQLTIKVADVPKDQLVSAMEKLNLEMLDARECSWSQCEGG